MTLIIKVLNISRSSLNIGESPRMNSKDPWYNRPILITIAGSIIVLVGQLAGTILPIYYSPNSISDFGVSINPPLCTYRYNITNDTINGLQEGILAERELATVEVDDFHQFVKPYHYDVSLRALDVPEGMSIIFETPNKRPPYKSGCRLQIPLHYPPGEYPITIQGIGGEGKRRNTTLVLNVIDESKKAPVPIELSYT